MSHFCSEKAVAAMEATMVRTSTTAAAHTTPDHPKAPYDLKPRGLLPDKEWDHDRTKPWNWPLPKTLLQAAMLCALALLSATSASAVSPEHENLLHDAPTKITLAILPLTVYVLAMAVGALVGGPLSESLGRYPVYVVGAPFGSLFALWAGITNHFFAFCVLRALAGLCWGAVQAVAAGSVTETFRPQLRSLVSVVFGSVLFMGSAVGPVIGASLITEDKWRWAHLLICLVSVVAQGLTFIADETFRPASQRRAEKKLKRRHPHLPPAPQQATLVRPLQMLLSEPIVTLVSLYGAVGCGTLYGLAGVPYAIYRIYARDTHYDVDTAPFIVIGASVAVGCLIAVGTVAACEAWLYRELASRFAPGAVPPEHRLYAAMMGSVGLPMGLLWFSWTVGPDVSPMIVAAAFVPFSWGGLCVYISTTQYLTEVYHPNVVASAVSASNFARYAFGGVVPMLLMHVFEMSEKVTLDQAASSIGFLALALLPIPWLLFVHGPRLRGKSLYPTISDRDKGL